MLDFVKSNYSKILRLIFILSNSFLTYLLSTRFTARDTIISVILSFIVGIILSKKITEYFLKVFNKKIFLISIIFSLYLSKLWSNYFGNNIYFINKTIEYLFGPISFDHINIIVAFFAIPSLIIFVFIGIEKILPVIKDFFSSLSKTERKFLIYLSIFGFIATCIIYFSTNVFYYPTHNNIEVADIIYTTDSGYIYSGDAYLNINMPENDIRQPLFGIFATPFAVIAHIISEFLFFIPSTYATIINTIQIIILGISLILISRILNLTDKNQKYFLIFNMVTFPIIIFSFVLEQYIFATFYLIITIYIGYKNILKVNYLYIGAVGTLITSGIFFPLISKFDNFKNWFKNVFKCFITFVTITILSGQLPQFINLKERFLSYSLFLGKELSFVDKLYQYLYFVRSIFFAPKGTENIGEISTYRLIDVSSISIIGLIILILCIISIILNRKNKFAIISFLWIVFSFVILCAIGWGTAENGLILYSLYFSWAFIVLIYLLITKVFKNIKTQHIIIVSLSVIMLLFNLIEFIRIFKFGIKYY